MILQEALKKIDERQDPGVIGQLLQSAMTNILEIACNTYGNFLIQILISKLSLSQRLYLLSNGKDIIIQLCSDQRGIFCV